MKPRHAWTLLAVLAIVTASGYRYLAPRPADAPDPDLGPGSVLGTGSDTGADAAGATRVAGVAGATPHGPQLGEVEPREFDGDSPFEPSSDVTLSDPAPVIPALSLSEGLPTRGNWRGNPAARDLNGDGHVDLVTSIRRWDRSTPAEGVHVFLGDGAGAWTPANGGLRRDMSYGGAELCDLDNDGHLDLAFSGHDTTPHVFHNDGAAGWTVMPRIGVENIASDVALGDLTGDGLADLAVLGFYPQEGGLVVFTGDGSGNFAPDATLMDPVNFGAEVAIHDIDADGLPDLLATTSRGLRMWSRSGEDPYEPWVERSNGLEIPPIGGSELGFAAQDLDGNGTLEVLVAGMVYEGHDALQILEFENETWSRIGRLPTDETFFDAAFARLGPDAPTSLYLAGKDGVSVLQESAPLRFERIGRIEGTVGVINVAALDVDGDGVDECAVIGFGGVRVLRPDFAGARGPEEHHHAAHARGAHVSGAHAEVQR